MKNVDRWFILIGLLYGTFGVGFGIWMGLYRSFPALAASRLATVHFLIYTIGAVVFLVGLPLAQSGQTIALAVVGSLMVLLGFLVFLVNYMLNGFSAKAGA
jgi:uncharacterized membrane protein